MQALSEIAPHHSSPTQHNDADGLFRETETLLAHVEELKGQAEQLETRMHLLRNNAKRAAKNDLSLAQLSSELERVSVPELDVSKAIATRDAAWQEAARAHRASNDAIKANCERYAAEIQKLQALLAKNAERLVAPSVAPAPAASATPEVEKTPTAPAPFPEEQRRHPRVQLNTSVEWHSEDNFYSGFTLDISEMGVFIATSDLQPLGSTVQLSIKLPSGYCIEGAGKVRWHREYNSMRPELLSGMGVELVALSAESQKAIRDFCNKRSPLFFVD